MDIHGIDDIGGDDNEDDDDDDHDEDQDLCFQCVKLKGKLTC